MKSIIIFFLPILMSIKRTKTMNNNQTIKLVRLDKNLILNKPEITQELKRKLHYSIDNCIESIKVKTSDIEGRFKLFELIMFNLYSSKKMINFNVNFYFLKFVNNKIKFNFLLNIYLEKKLPLEIKNLIEQRFLRFLFEKYSEIKKNTLNNFSLRVPKSSNAGIIESIISFNKFLIYFAKNNLQLYKTSFLDYSIRKKYDNDAKKFVPIYFSYENLKKVFNSQYFKRTSKFCPMLKEVKDFLNRNNYSHIILKRLHLSFTLFLTKYNTLIDLFFVKGSELFTRKFIPKYKIDVFQDLLIDFHFHLILFKTEIDKQNKMKNYFLLKSFALYCSLRKLTCMCDYNQVTFDNMENTELKKYVKIITKKYFINLEQKQTSVDLIYYLGQK